MHEIKTFRSLVKVKSENLQRERITQVRYRAPQFRLPIRMRQYCEFVSHPYDTRTIDVVCDCADVTIVLQRTATLNRRITRSSKTSIEAPCKSSERSRW